MPDLEFRTRRHISVRGLVQGVGFRPFVAKLAARHGLTGTVDNGPEGVDIVLEGPSGALDAFVEELRPLAPPLAVLASVRVEMQQATGLRDFRILPSRNTGSTSEALIPPDVATCPACLAELRDPADRRHGYPFLNCTQCGPRYTIVDSLPYDRPGTSMAGFVLCPACRAEYDSPTDRRFHAQPTACPLCGPRLSLLDAAGRPLPCGDPLGEAARRLAAGQIVALKGVGGYQLACDPKVQAVVERLRQLKGRPHKPFALMVRNLELADELAWLTEHERGLLASWRAPILLCTPRLPSPLAPAVRGGSAQLGLFLPYSPLHHLLLAAGPAALVMTSGNRSGEVLAHRDDEALERLAGIADAFLVHDREIRAPLEDSVVRLARGHPVLLRRGRGWVPQPVLLSRAGPSVLALGADLKSACCLTRGDQAFPGPCLGDLAVPENSQALEESARHLVRLLGTRPSLVVHDLHPDYHSTRLAQLLTREWQVPLLAVQHHHAHALAVLAEHGLAEQPVLAVCLDGTGFGPDGLAWGGEFLRVAGLHVKRLARLWELPLPGGERAAREPWRMGLAALATLTDGEAGIDWTPWRHLPCFHAAEHGLVEGVSRELGQPLPRSCSAGRLLDAVASLLGVCQRMSYEGQAPAELEDLAATAAADVLPYPFAWLPAEGSGRWAAEARLDTRPLLRALLADLKMARQPAVCARRVHATLREMIVQSALRARNREGLERVALCGGVFQNRLLVEETRQALEERAFQVLEAAQVPPNDEGIALGQAWAGNLSSKEGA